MVAKGLHASLFERMKESTFVGKILWWFEATKSIVRTTTDRFEKFAYSLTPSTTDHKNMYMKE